MTENPRVQAERDGLAYDPDRTRGILTPSDRAFLLGDKSDYTDHSKKVKRNRIRQRVRNAILDFSILFDYLDDRDRQTVFDPGDEIRDAYTQGLVDALAFCYLGTLGYPTPFEDLLAAGIHEAEQKLAGSDYRMVSVTFSVDPIGRIDVDEVIDALEAGRFDELTDEQLRAFVRLLATAEEFSAAVMRETIAAQLDEFVAQTTVAAEERDRRTEELTE